MRSDQDSYPGFNRIREWLVPILSDLDMSVEDLSKEANVSRTAIYHYFNDKYRPTEDTMARICHAVGKPFEEGLQQYTPNRMGRPYV